MGKNGYMKQSEIAELLGVSRPTVFRFLRDRGIVADMIDGQTQLYSSEHALEIVDAYRASKSQPVEGVNSEPDQETADNQSMNASIEQVIDWKMVADIYKEQLDFANASLSKALDSLSKEQETKEQLLLQLESEKNREPEKKKGWFSKFFNR